MGTPPAEVGADVRFQETRRMGTAVFLRDPRTLIELFTTPA